ncbi:homoserine kinase [Halobacillus sp. MO56]
MDERKKFSDSELAHIMGNYDMGKYLDSDSFTEGRVQTNISIQTTKGQFVLRYYESRSFESVSFEVHLLSYLKERKFPCPKPFRNKQEDFIGIYDSKPYVVFDYLEGYHVQEPNQKQKKQVIQSAAQLHNLTMNYIPICKESRWNYNIEFCKKQAQEVSHRINTKNSKAKFSWLENELKNLNLPKSLPKGICHADFDFSNILFRNEEFNALLDFDDANYTYLLFDLVNLIESWAWRHDKDEILNFREAKKIVDEYRKHRLLTEEETHHLFDVYKLSILIDCIWLFERGEIDDFYEKRKINFLDHIGREAFYNKLFS